LIRTAQEMRPNLPAILLNRLRRGRRRAGRRRRHHGTFSLLRKPVSGTQLIDRINALLASRKQSSKV